MDRIPVTRRAVVRQRRRGRTRLVVCAAGWTLWAVGAAAQPSLVADDSSEPNEPIDAEQALASAVDSFRSAAEKRLEQLLDERGDPPKASAEALRERIEAAVQEFERESRSGLTERRGDGALTFDEVTAELADERSENLNELDNLLRADLEGVAPPPTTRSDGPPHRSIGKIAHYTVLVRNPPLRWLIFAGWVVAGVLLAGLITRGLRAIPRSRFPRTQAAFSALDGPLYGAAALAGLAIGFEWIWLPAGVRDAVELIVRFSIALVLLWLVWILCDVAAQGIGWVVGRTRSGLGDHRIDLIRKALRLAASAVFALLAADLLFGTDIRAVLAGLGILTLGVSLAAQDTFKNLIGSLTVYGDRPFVRGDLISYRDVLGTVEDIGFRSTRLRRLTGELVTIPNADVVKEPIENLTSRPWFRTRLRVDLAYDTPPDRVEQALEGVRELLGKREHQPGDRPCEVLLEELGSHSLRILVEFAHDSGDFWEGMRESSDVKLAIHRLFADEGFEFAFPTETIDLRTPTAERPGGPEPDSHA